MEFRAAFRRLYAEVAYALSIQSIDVATLRELLAIADDALVAAVAERKQP